MPHKNLKQCPLFHSKHVPIWLMSGWFISDKLDWFMLDWLMPGWFIPSCFMPGLLKIGWPRTGWQMTDWLMTKCLDETGTINYSAVVGGCSMFLFFLN